MHKFLGMFLFQFFRYDSSDEGSQSSEGWRPGGLKKKKKEQKVTETGRLVGIGRDGLVGTVTDTVTHHCHSLAVANNTISKCWFFLV